MKKLLSILLVLTITIGVWAGGAGETGPITIGVAGPHTGDFAAYGIPTLRAAEILTEKVNAEGGIGGRSIQLVIVDDLCDPAQATTVASRLVAENAVAVLGHICSGATISAMATYINAGIPVISPSATNPTLTKSGDYSGFFRTIAPDDLQGVTQAQFLANILNVKKVAIIHDQQDYGKRLADATKAELERLGVTVALYEGIGVGAVDYSAVVSKVINENVDAVVFGGYHSEGSKIINQLVEKGYDGAFIAGDGMKTDDFINLAGPASEGAYATSPRDYSDNIEYAQAKEEYEAMYNGEKPGIFYYEGYAAFSIILEAIREGNSTPQQITDFLLSGISFDTPVGTIFFDKNGDAQGTGFDIYQVQSGTYITIE